MTIYFKKHDNILICREKKHLIFKNLESYPNLAWAEYLPPWAFLDFFCKISTPAEAKPFKPTLHNVNNLRVKHTQ